MFSKIYQINRYFISVTKSSVTLCLSVLDVYVTLNSKRSTFYFSKVPVVYFANSLTL